MPQKKVGGIVHKFESHYRYAARKTGLPTASVKVAVEVVLESVAEQTKRYGSSKLAKMLIFKRKTKTRALAGEWKNPSTGQIHVLPARPIVKTVTVHPTPKLKAKMN